MPVLMALFLMLWPSVLSATFVYEAGIGEEVCGIPATLPEVRVKPDVKPEICVKRGCDESFELDATRGMWPPHDCLENDCIRFFEPPPGFLGHVTVNKLKAYLEQKAEENWVEFCMEYWLKMLPGGLPDEPPDGP